MVSLAASVGGVPLSCCVYNASGPKSGHTSDLANVGKSRSGAVLSKSATLLSQKGNELPRLKKIKLAPGVCEGSINSEGLPNAGIDYYVGEKVAEDVSKTGKPYIVSISGLKLADNLEMLSRIAAAKESGRSIAAVELNLACPNIPGKPTIAYDFDQVKDVLKQVTDHASFKASGLPLGIKLAPYFDIPHYQAVAEIINAHKDRVRYVVTMNTIGNALLVDGESEMAMISPKKGFGGLGGGFTKQVALANVRQLSLLLAPEIDVVGVGGVATGMDAFELILCGASAVQVATQHWIEGPKCFDRIAGELESIMRRKGYKTLADFRGKLKEFDRSQAKPAIGGSEEATTSSKDMMSLPWMLLASMVPVLCFLLKREITRWP